MRLDLRAWDFAAEVIDPSQRWRPQPKQALATARAAEVDELLYGGAVGGGKTEWLIHYMIDQCEAHPGNRVLILRRTFPSLNRSVIPRSKSALAGRARWNSQEHTFTFPNGSVLELGSLQYADDVYRYQGAEYGCIGFEEITEFLEEQVDYLRGRLRSTIPGVRPHLVATTNPGGVGHRWVKRRWIRPERSERPEDGSGVVAGKPWRPRPTEEVPRPGSRCFVPAKLQDNPALMEADPGYLDRVLATKNRAVRQALAAGDWDAIDAVEGALWSAEDLDLGRVRPEVVELEIGLYRKVIAVDPSDGGDDEDVDGFGVCYAGLGMDRVGYVLRSWEWRARPGEMARRALRLYRELGCDAIVVERNHGGQWLMEVFRQADPRANLVEVWASVGKKARAEPVAALFEPNPHRNPDIAARMAGFHEELEEELTTTVFEPGMRSPNRLDAMVWALSELVIAPGTAGRVHKVRDRRLAAR